jgi:hypothetical protein
VQPSKQNLEIVSSDEGIQIAWSDEASLNANSPKLEILQPGSNIADKTELH